MKSFSRQLARLSSDHQRIAKGAARVALLLLLGKFAGAAKEMAVAYRYGVSDAVDAYQFTFTLASWLPVTLVGVLSVVLIPVLVRTRRETTPQRCRFLSELQAWGIAAGVVLAVGIYVAWPWVLEFAGQGLNPQTRAMSLQLTWAFAPAALLTLVSGISAARLRAHERHLNTLLDSVPAVVILIWVLLAATAKDVGPLLWGTLVGYFIQSVLLLWLAGRADGTVARPHFGFSSAHWPELVKAAGVMLIGQVAMSFVGPIDQYTAATLGDNTNATLGYATRLLALLLGVGAASVGRAALPVLADIHSRGDALYGRVVALKWSVFMVLAGVLVTLAGWWLAPMAVSVLFERGAFTGQDTLRVAAVVQWGLLQLPFYFGVLILVQLLASQNRYRLMAAIAVANFSVKAAMNTVLAPQFGAQGIMLATALMYASSYVCYAIAALRYTPPQS